MWLVHGCASGASEAASCLQYRFAGVTNLVNTAMLLVGVLLIWARNGKRTSVEAYGCG